MSKDVIFDLIGEVRAEYIAEAQRHRGGQAQKRHSLKKPLMAALIAAVMLVLVGCGVAYAQGWFVGFFSQRAENPLTQAEAAYIEKIEQPVNETMAHTQPSTSEAKTCDGYTLRVKSTITDGNMAYITIGVTAPKDVLLSKTAILGYDPSAPSICAGNFMAPGFLEPENGTAKFGYTSMGALEDNDGLDYTQDLILTVEAEMEDGSQPFTSDKVWKLHIEDLVATYCNLEALEAMDNLHGGGEYIAFNSEDNLDPYPNVTLAEGGWDYEIIFADNGVSSIELIREPVTSRVVISGKYADDPDTYQNVNITSFVLSSLSATVEVDIDGFPEMQDYQNNKYVYAVMKDGTQVELFSRATDGPGRVKLEAKRPINLSQLDHVLLADGTKLPA